MNVASLSLCKELWELTGWAETEFTWRYHTPHKIEKLLLTDEKLADENRYRHQPRDIALRFAEENAFYPAYDLGYLLRRLPKYTHVWITEAGAEAECYYPKQKTATVHGDTPENATAKLAIELFKQGIIKP